MDIECKKILSIDGKHTITCLINHPFIEYVKIYKEWHNLVKGLANAPIINSMMNPCYPMPQKPFFDGIRCPQFKNTDD